MLIVKDEDKQRMRELQDFGSFCKTLAYLALYGSESCKVHAKPAFDEPYVSLVWDFGNGHTMQGAAVFRPKGEEDLLAGEWTVHT